MAGEQVNPDREAAGASAMVVLCDAPLAVAETVTLEDAAIVPAVAEKVAAVVPAPTVTDAGTVNRPELEESATESPPVGAAFDRLTVQVETAPELRVDGLQVTLEGMAGAERVRVNVCVTPL